MYINKPKDYLIQITNPEFIKLSEKKFIRYNGRRLYVDHLIDLLHGFYDKAIRHDKTGNDTFKSTISRFCISHKLNTRILLKKYGRYYKTYIDYLVEEKYIKLGLGYVSSKRSNTYEIIPSKYNPKELVYYQNYDSSKHKRLLKFYNEEVNLIPRILRIDENVMRKTIDNLLHISIDEEKAIEILKSIYPDEKSNKYYRNHYCIKTISNSQIYLVPDEYGRIHTNFTVLKKEIRNECLSIENEKIYERDVRNSQPFFLLKLMADHGTYISRDGKDLKKYFGAVSAGWFYEEVNKFKPELNRDEIKRWIMMVFFNKNYFHDKDFYQVFPTVYRFIKKYKKENGYKSLAHRLQNIESDFIFNTVCKRLIQEKIKYFTVHDSICVKDSDKEILNETFDNELLSYLHDVEVNLFQENNI